MNISQEQKSTNWLIEAAAKAAQKQLGFDPSMVMAMHLFEAYFFEISRKYITKKNRHCLWFLRDSGTHSGILFDGHSGNVKMIGEDAGFWSDREKKIYRGEI